MKNLLLILKANKSAINIFKLKGKNNKIVTTLLTIFASACVLFAVGIYAYLMAEQLHEVGYTRLIVAFFMIITTVIVFLSGVHKSQGVLFAAKDNDLLFSMPIDKNIVLAARVILLVIYQYLWTLILMIPTYIVYAMFEHPGISFYILSLIMLIVMPIIPTILSAIIGYIISLLSAKFKKSNLATLVFNFVFTFAIFMVSMNIDTYLSSIVANAQSIEEILSKVYLPLGIYMESLVNLNVIKFITMVIANFGLLIAFVAVFSKWYYSIISKLSERYRASNYTVKELKQRGIFKSLLSKEIKRYFSSSAYVINTMFYPVMLVMASVYAIYLKITGGLEEVLIGEFAQYLPLAILSGMFLGMATMVTTASSISIEGKNLWLTKSLPITAKDIFNAKTYMNVLVMAPAILIAEVVIGICLNLSAIAIICIGITSVIQLIIDAKLGLAINLLLPKLDAQNDVQIVKQSASTIVTMISSIIVGAVIMLLPFGLNLVFEGYSLLVLAIQVIVILVLNNILYKWGKNKLYQL